ncbi:asparagine synthase-related protein [Dyella ginsengisoli]|uniref:asparagine synthase-related protein n=1 Tax=Dyella ginsengisoli TaxID=363848 RepID=UPI000376E4F6|nr:asparagine synthase-related protein [Dyella ginsengisoli]
MLKADIAWGDLSQNPEWKHGVIALGRSQIAPFQHAALETLVVQTQERWFAVVRERVAGAAVSENASFQNVDSERFDELYRACLLWPLDYVMVEVAKQGRRVKLRAGMLGAAPVYCRATDEQVRVSWDFADFLSDRLPIDFEAASCSLGLEQVYSSRQICIGVYLLTERATLYLEPGRAHYRYPSPFEVPAAPAMECADAVSMFDQLLRRVIAKRPAAPGRIAVELSGGMDSAAVACALADLHGPVASRGILVGGECRVPQVERRRQIADRLRLSDETVDIDAIPPSLDLSPDGHKAYVNTEYYLEAFETLWSTARAQGRDLMYTGLGGDELFMGTGVVAEDNVAGGRSIGDPQRFARQLLTPRALSALRSLHAFDAPAGPVPSVMASVSKAHHLMQHGMWPINPLSDPDLMVFCYQLPLELRRRRTTMQLYLDARLGEDVFPRNYAKETFAQVFPELIARHRTALAGQLRECALADLGLVDQRAALALLDTVATTKAVAPTSPLINFLWTERFARQLT